VIAIGLTGGIGSGKTTVAARLEALGAAVVDTDAIARSLTAAGGAALEAVRQGFGERFVGADGALDRAAMRDLVFEDRLAREKLEAILHPAIRTASDRALAEAKAPYALVVVPLLFETRGYMDRLQRVLVVDCPEALQLDRTARRSQLAPERVRSIMATQWPRWRRLQMADDVVWNGGDAPSLDPQCERLHVFYAALARDRDIHLSTP
jgi:dephospho-CoA kinase